MFTLVFKDGHTETIPMSKVHIEPDGITELPENGYPIVAESKLLWLTSGYVYKYGQIKFGVDSDNDSVAGISNERNDSQGNTSGRPKKGYLPICVNTLENLKNGEFIYDGNVSKTSGNETWYVWAEK